jgi:hypothetical protein
MESDYVLPGERIVAPVETPVGKVGLAIVSFSCEVITSLSSSYHLNYLFMHKVDDFDSEKNEDCSSLSGLH